MKKFWQDQEGTGLLVVFAAWYFGAYVLTGLDTKIFTKGLLGIEKIGQMTNLYHSTLGGAIICLVIVAVLGWGKLFRGDAAVSYRLIVLCGVCTAVIILGTTLMYTFIDMSVMVAMLIMRSSVIVITRVVDAIQIKRGILKKKVGRLENLAIVFAIGAVAVIAYKEYVKDLATGKDTFAFLTYAPVMAVLLSYLAAYAIRLYWLNWYKHTKRDVGDNRAFFAAEQAFASFTLIVVAIAILFASSGDVQIVEIQRAARAPNIPAVIGGMAFGLAAIPSVFLFMFKGRTATFSGLVNRLTSLVAGTASTLILAWFVDQPMPEIEDWQSFGLVVIAVGLIAHVEQKRVKERT